jgi:lysophospholipase L1-like esterase
MPTYLRFAVLGAVAVAACSSSNDTTTTSDAGGISSDAGTVSDASTSADATSDAGPDAIPLPTACPSQKHATLVVVGDSISDIGSGSGADEQPFYRTLLVQNDDALYPDYKGFDLKTCWGLDPGTGVVKVSKGGAIATVPDPNDPTSMHILLNQVKSLPATLTGPVLVVGTIGGNDITAGLTDALLGNTAKQQADIDAFVAGFGAAMAELTKADRFGPGVKVDVLITNVYDPSGGTGHFYYMPENKACPGPLAIWPDNQSTDGPLAQWNAAMATEAAKYPGVKLLNMHDPFKAHRVGTPTGTCWYHDDCIHPNASGHNGIRGIFYNAIVGLK